MINYKQHFIETDRIRTAYHRIGEGNEKKLLVLHGNLSSSVFFMPLAPYLDKKYDIAVPDMRCFGHTQALPIDATRGYRDWSDDIYAFCRAIGWEHFTLLGWSMGGDIAMQFVIDHEEMVDRLILVAPGSPYGFGGTIDEKGTPHTPLGLGSGGGTSNPALILPASMGSRTVMRDILHKFLFNSAFRMNNEWENRFIEEMSLMRIGADYYPGNFKTAAKWPYIAAGDRGVLNTMTPNYGNLSAFLDVKKKPKVLWIRGDRDMIVSDGSMMELGYLGKIGLVPGWPGEDKYPPQPMVAQTRYFLDQYKERGGFYVEAVIPGGHVCILESPIHFISALDAFCR
ncbi:MAG: alpha/beta hydrolase [Lachnospiraceae bacterium]|nr:alpha/beta hydrolase [Lachnospiraceae bacterium]